MTQPGPAREALTRDDLRRVLGIDDEFLLLLEEERICWPDPQGRYEPATVERVRICWSLHHDLGVNLEGLEVAITLLERIRDERRQFRDVLAWLEQQLRR